MNGPSVASVLAEFAALRELMVIERLEYVGKAATPGRVLGRSAGLVGRAGPPWPSTEAFRTAA